MKMKNVDGTVIIVVAIWVFMILMCVFASVWLTLNNHETASVGIFGLAILLVICFPQIHTKD